MLRYRSITHKKFGNKLLNNAVEKTIYINSSSKMSSVRVKCKKFVYLNFKQPEKRNDFVEKSLIAVKIYF